MSLSAKFTKVLLAVAVWGIANQAYGQTNHALQYEQVRIFVDTTLCPLHETYVSNDSLTVAFYYATMFFPELCANQIHLKYGSIKTSMAAQPRIWSIFRKREKRKYKIVVNKNSQSAQAKLLHAAPFDALIGVMGHEMSHVLDYSKKSGWQVAWFGIRYLGKNYRRKVERQTDSIAIMRGFGEQLYRYSFFVVREADVSEKYRQYKLDFYMKPEEIYEMMKNIEVDH